MREALEDAAHNYKRNYVEGQNNGIWIVVEKATLLGQLARWLSPYGTTYTALRGYGSQTLADRLAGNASRDDGFETTTMLYIGDHDPSGHDIQRDIIDRTNGVFDEVVRLAVNPEQVSELGLHPAPGKTTDSRAGQFMADHGELIQVEVEAIEPDVLKSLIVNAVEERTDMDLLNSVKAEEEDEKDQIFEFINSFNDDGAS